MSQANILVVDDEQDIRNLVCEILEDEGYAVTTAENGEAARTAFSRSQPDLVLLDIWMPDVDGISLLKEWSESGNLTCPVVMISGHGTLETAVEATRLGAFDFVQKPLSLAKLLATVRNALAAETPGAESTSNTGPAAAAPQGSSPQSQLLRRTAKQAASTRESVMVTGEAGTGKETLAAWIHEQSGLTGPFFTLDRTSLDEESLRDYLFGAGSRPGALAAASGGTLFIPEIHELPNEAQTLLSAVFENGKYRVNGNGDDVALDCRIIAATSRDPDSAIADDELNRSLYLQVAVLPIHIAPLRERAQDVTDLVGHHADRLSNAEKLAYRHFSISSLNRLRNHDWPGNEKELVNLVKRLLVLGSEGEVTAQEAEEALNQPRPPSAPSGASGQPVSYDLPLREAREAFERDYLIYQLRKAGGSVGKLSEAVGMERTHLYRKLRSLGIDPKKVVNS